jgi:signal transduction histidine kinase
MGLLSSKTAVRVSDESRYFPAFPHGWFAPAVGLAAGSAYAFLEFWFDRFIQKGTVSRWAIAHELFDWVTPIVLGFTAGFGVLIWHKVVSMNQSLSTQNTHLKSHLLTNTLFAHILHEIRNPIHNLSAVMDTVETGIAASDREIIKRNLSRLKDLTDQLKRVSVSDKINPLQPVLFREWAESFLQQAVIPTIRKLKIRYEQKIDPLILHVHPLLLEQCLTVIFQNAIVACSQDLLQRNSIYFSASYDGRRHGYSALALGNSGAFPAEVIESSGRSAVKSSQGLGFGLVLLRDTVESVGGKMEITNEEGCATVRLYLPAERPA